MKDVGTFRDSFRSTSVHDPSLDLLIFFDWKSRQIICIIDNLITLN